MKMELLRVWRRSAADLNLQTLDLPKRKNSLTSLHHGRFKKTGVYFLVDGFRLLVSVLAMLRKRVLVYA